MLYIFKIIYLIYNLYFTFLVFFEIILINDKKDVGGKLWESHH